MATVESPGGRRVRQMRPEGDAASGDDPEELKQRIGELERRLEQMEAARTSRATVLLRIVPPEALDHLRVGTREQLLAARVMLDSWIARLQGAREEAPPTRENIRIE